MIHKGRLGRILEIEREILTIMLQYFNHDEDETQTWYQSPNEILFGDTPVSCVWSGDGERLLEWLKQRLKPGSER